MTSSSSQTYESYVPVYDFVPEKWQDARIMLVEALKIISNTLNVREIGFLLTEEVLTGKALYATTNNPQFRSVFRTVINAGTINAGNNTFAHGLTVNASFQLVDLWASASKNTVPYFGTPINGTGNKAAARAGLDINYDNTNVYVYADQTYQVCNIFFEYVYQD